MLVPLVNLISKAANLAAITKGLSNTNTAYMTNLEIFSITDITQSFDYKNLH